MKYTWYTSNFTSRRISKNAPKNPHCFSECVVVVMVQAWAMISRGVSIEQEGLMDEILQRSVPVVLAEDDDDVGLLGGEGRYVRFHFFLNRKIFLEEKQRILRAVQ